MRQDPSAEQGCGQELHGLFADGDERLQRFHSAPAVCRAERRRGFHFYRAFWHLVQDERIHFDLLFARCCFGRITHICNDGMDPAFNEDQVFQVLCD